MHVKLMGNPRTPPLRLRKDHDDVLLMAIPCVVSLALKALHPYEMFFHMPFLSR